MARIVYHDENFQTSYADINAQHPEITIGRNPGNTLIIPKKSLSRQHAKILYQGNKYFLIDLKSSNGTKVNDMRVSYQEIHPGDRIVFGDVKVDFIEDNRPGMTYAPSAAPQPGNVMPMGMPPMAKASPMPPAPMPPSPVSPATMQPSPMAQAPERGATMSSRPISAGGSFRPTMPNQPAFDDDMAKVISEQMSAPAHQAQIPKPIDATAAPTSFNPNGMGFIPGVNGNSPMPAAPVPRSMGGEKGMAPMPGMRPMPAAPQMPFNSGNNMNTGMRPGEQPIIPPSPVRMGPVDPNAAPASFNPNSSFTSGQGTVRPSTMMPPGQFSAIYPNDPNLDDLIAAGPQPTQPFALTGRGKMPPALITADNKIVPPAPNTPIINQNPGYNASPNYAAPYGYGEAQSPDEVQNPAPFYHPAGAANPDFIQHQNNPNVFYNDQIDAPIDDFIDGPKTTACSIDPIEKPNIFDNPDKPAQSFAPDLQPADSPEQSAPYEEPSAKPAEQEPEPAVQAPEPPVQALEPAEQPPEPSEPPPEHAAHPPELAEQPLEADNHAPEPYPLAPEPENVINHTKQEAAASSAPQPRMGTRNSREPMNAGDASMMQSRRPMRSGAYNRAYPADNPVPASNVTNTTSAPQSQPATSGAFNRMGRTTQRQRIGSHIPPHASLVSDVSEDSAFTNASPGSSSYTRAPSGISSQNHPRVSTGISSQNLQRVSASTSSQNLKSISSSSDKHEACSISEPEAIQPEAAAPEQSAEQPQKIHPEVSAYEDGKVEKLPLKSFDAEAKMSDGESAPNEQPPKQQEIPVDSGDAHDSLQSQLDEANARNASLLAELDSLKADLESKKALESKVAELEADLESKKALEAKIAKIPAVLKAKQLLEAKVAELQADLEAKQALEEENADLRHEIESKFELEEEVGNLRHELESKQSLETELDSLRAELEANNGADISGMKAEMEMLRQTGATVQSLRDELRQTRADRDSAVLQSERLNADIQTLQLTLKQTQSQCDDLTNQLNQSQQNEQDLQDSLEQAQIEFNGASERLAQLRSQASSLEENLSQMQAERDEAYQKLEQMSQMPQANSEEIEQIRAERDEAYQKLEQIDASIQAQVEEIQSKNLAEIARIKAECQQSVDAVKANCRQQMDDIQNEANARIAEIEQNFAAGESKRIELETTINDLNAQIAALNASGAQIETFKKKWAKRFNSLIQYAGAMQAVAQNQLDLTPQSKEQVNSMVDVLKFCASEIERIK